MGYRLTKIYTRTGDDGSTSVSADERLLKNHPLLELLGTLDELNSAIGFASSLADETFQSYFTVVQHELFDLGGELCPPHHLVITAEKIARLEKDIDHFNESLPPLKEFILPGGNPASAACHLARAICRRAERLAVTLSQEKKFNVEILRYLNRLSDFLFVFARILGKDNTVEVLWEHERKK